MRKLAVVAVIAISCGAQVMQRGDNSKNIYPFPPGKVTSHLEPRVVPISLDHLVELSELIVAGTVLSSRPPINRNSKIPDAIETHSVIAVSEVLSGKLPNDADRLLLVQEGGKVGLWEKVVPDDPLVKSGENYILFLNSDSRAQPPHISGLPRYDAVGIWAGKVKIINDKIAFLSNSNAQLHKYDNLELNTFLGMVRDRINHKIIPPKRDGVPHPGPNAVQGEGTLRKP